MTAPNHSYEPAAALRRSARDPHAFGQFYEANDVHVLAFFARRTYDIEVSRDLTAETFAQAFRSRKRFRGTTDEEARAWLYGIARHLLSRYVRRGAVVQRASAKLGIELPELQEGEQERIIELAGLQDIRATVAEQFDRLGEDQRRAVQLRVVDELPYRDVAARLDITEATARARVSRGLRQLAELLDRLPQFKETMT
jgi:RNA polymerase sigma-70 factor (ECF subfamily)